MPFGLTNAPATFQRLMEMCMGDMNLKECLLFLDDILIFSSTFQEHLVRLESVFQRLHDYKLKLNPKKCEFFKSQVRYLGHVISEKGIMTDPEKTSALENWPVPCNVKSLRSFLGFTGYYRRFIKDYARIVKPLNDLLIGQPTNKATKKNRKRKKADWKWDRSRSSRLSSPSTKETSTRETTRSTLSETSTRKMSAGETTKSTLSEPSCPKEIVAEPRRSTRIKKVPDSFDMDPSKCAQDVIRCDLCEDAIVQMYCDFCHVNLCVSCIGKHISDDYDKHKVVPFQQRKSTLIYPECTIHQTKRCEFHCKECQTSLCSLCTTMSETRKKHTVSTLFDIFCSMREVLEKDIEELENVISPTYEEIAIGLETQMANLDGEYKKLTTAVIQHGEKCHREINIIVDKMKTEIEELKIKHMSILKEHWDEIKQIQYLIKQTSVNLEEIEESNKVSEIIEYSSKNREFSKLPPKVQVQLPTFSPKTINTKQLYEVFGSLATFSTTKEENGYKLKESKTLTKELLKEPTLLTTINTGYEKLCSITSVSDEEIWTSTSNTPVMRCFNLQGLMMKTIQTKSATWSSDIAVTRDGDLLYSDWVAKTVNKVKNKETKEVISLQGWIPLNLCVTSSGDILVTMSSDDQTQSKVVRYSGSTEIQTIQFDGDVIPLYLGSNKIKYITENRNLDICVADAEARAVVVVNQTGKLRFRYTGNPDKSFEPFGITTDSQSQILTADCNNHCIHILGQDGQFLRYMDKCNLKNPFGLYVGKNDDLFVAEHFSGKVKKIKYLKL